MDDSEVALALDYPGEWKFEGTGFGIPPAAVDAFFNLIQQIAGDSREAQSRGCDR